jgi:hypothetical protein
MEATLEADHKTIKFVKFHYFITNLLGEPRIVSREVMTQ